MDHWLFTRREVRKSPTPRPVQGDKWDRVLWLKYSNCSISWLGWQRASSPCINTQPWKIFTGKKKQVDFSEPNQGGPYWFHASFAQWIEISLHLLHFLFVFHSYTPCPSFLVFQHTDTHANEAARRELIRADRTQWHPWHFREKACRFKAPQGCVVRILQTDESLREWAAEGCRGGWGRGRLLERQGPGSQDIYLVRYAIRGQLSVILAAVKLLKMISQRNRSNSSWPQSGPAENLLELEILWQKLKHGCRMGHHFTSHPSADGLVQQKLTTAQQ